MSSLTLSPDAEKTVNNFLSTVKTSQTLWALQEKGSDEWVVLDSLNFENSEVMPLWSSQALAQEHCIDEWSDYVATEINVADWFEFWIEDLNEDGVMLGLNWPASNDDITAVELELSDFTQVLSTIEKL
tara:strand:- start:515 stop:901 length:387 start_codon:yes stop_codon:yes gene_type:complete